MEAAGEVEVGRAEQHQVGFVAYGKGADGKAERLGAVERCRLENFGGSEGVVAESEDLAHDAEHVTGGTGDGVDPETDRYAGRAQPAGDRRTEAEARFDKRRDRDT